MAKQSEKSRHIGGKSNTRDEADNRKRSAKEKRYSPEKGQGSPPKKPKNADVGDLDQDR